MMNKIIHILLFLWKIALIWWQNVTKTFFMSFPQYNILFPQDDMPFPQETYIIPSRYYVVSTLILSCSLKNVYFVPSRWYIVPWRCAIPIRYYAVSQRHIWIKARTLMTIESILWTRKCKETDKIMYHHWNKAGLILASFWRSF